MYDCPLHNLHGNLNEEASEEGQITLYYIQPHHKDIGSLTKEDVVDTI